MTSLGAGRWYIRHGPKQLMFAGASLTCLGALTLMRMPDTPNYPQIAAGMTRSQRARNHFGFVNHGRGAAWCERVSDPPDVGSVTLQCVEQVVAGITA